MVTMSMFPLLTRDRQVRNCSELDKLCAGGGRLCVVLVWMELCAGGGSLVWCGCGYGVG